MSSNAFARSRPRVRHQRVPKTQSYAHPRFLQLVRELARIDEAKKKQEEADSNCIADSTKADQGAEPRAGGCINHASVAQAELSLQTSRADCSVIHNTSVITQCCTNLSLPNISCCAVMTEAQSSNGYRPLDCNQSSTSALNDNYYRHNNTSHNQQYHNSNNHNHLHNLHRHHHHHHHYGNHHDNIQQQEVSYLGNNHAHHHCREDRCVSKCPPTNQASTTNTTNFGFSKQGLLEQNNPDFFNAISDLRQDENRSKRKRSSNDSLPSSKKIIASSSSCGANSKRHKSSPEPSRPLSPSFTKCPICLLDCMDRDPSFTNTCFHLFCYVCIENWSKNKATCPLCRTKFNKIVYNIRSASCFDEKVASPIRRDDDDDRAIYEQLQLQGLASNPMTSSRSLNAEDTRLFFDNLRNGEVLTQPFTFVNQIESRQVDSLHSFNPVTSSSNFNSNVPQPFAGYSYNYAIPMIPPNNRIQPAVSTAITSAYVTSSDLTNLSGDSSNRPRTSRSGRYIHHPRHYDLVSVDNDSTRVSRSTSTNMNQTAIPQHHHQSHHSHHNQPGQYRSGALEMLSRQNLRNERLLHMPYPIETLFTSYSRRRAPSIDQQAIDILYRQMPDM